MEMKINLDSIFASSVSDHEPNTHQSSLHSEQDLNQSFEFRYKLRNDIFDTSVTSSHNSIKIPKIASQTLSDSFESEIQWEGKLPGERLYYESMNSNMRKKQEIQRIRQQKIASEKREVTFRPKINKNSETIVSKKDKKTNGHEFMDPYYGQEKPVKKQIQSTLTTKERKQKEEAMECTFKPKLIAKNMTKQSNTKEEVFDHLFNEYKVKKYKQKMKIEEEQSEKNKHVKKIGKEDFQKFLDRNNSFLAKVQRKNQMVVAASSEYDLVTGNKLFSPRISNAKAPFPVNHKSGAQTKSSKILQPQKHEQKRQNLQKKTVNEKQPFKALAKNKNKNEEKIVKKSKVPIQVSSSLFHKHDEEVSEEPALNILELRKIRQEQKEVNEFMDNRESEMQGNEFSERGEICDEQFQKIEEQEDEYEEQLGDDDEINEEFHNKLGIASMKESSSPDTGIQCLENVSIESRNQVLRQKMSEPLLKPEEGAQDEEVELEQNE